MPRKLSPLDQFLINVGGRSPRAVTGGLLLELEGGLDLDRLHHAWMQMGEVVPQLRTKIGAETTSQGSRPSVSWLEPERGALPFKVRSLPEDPQGDDVVSLFAHAIDLREGPGGRLSVHQGPGRTILLLEYHGAVGDGTWALRLGELLLLAYAQGGDGHGDGDEDRDGVGKEVGAGDWDKDWSREWVKVPTGISKGALRPSGDQIDPLDRDGLRLSAAALASGLAKVKGRWHGAMGRVASRGTRSWGSGQWYRVPSDTTALRMVSPSLRFLTLELDAAYLASLGRSGQPLEGPLMGRFGGREFGGPVDDAILRDVSVALGRWRPAAVPWPQGCQALLCERTDGEAVRSWGPPECHGSLVPFFLFGTREEPRGEVLERIHQEMPLLRRQGLSPRSLRMLARCGRLSDGTAPFVVFQQGAFAAGLAPLQRERDGTVVVHGSRVQRVSLLPSLWGIGSFGVGVVRYRRGLCLTLTYDGAIWDSAAMAGLLALIREELDHSVAETAKVTHSLDQLIARHLQAGRRSPPLHALPIGKHVSLAPTTLPELRHKKEGKDSSLQAAREHPGL